MQIQKWYLFIVLICVSLTVDSQENVYFTNHPVWKIQTNNAHEYPCMKYYTGNVFLGDTLTIDTKVYYPVYERYEMEYDWQSPLPPYPFCNGTGSVDSVFKGFIRSFDKRMYFRNALNAPDVLLHDFNLAVGDSIYGTALIPFDTLIVVAIDSFPVPGGFWKRFEVDGNDYTDYILEGIGSTTGLYQSMMQPYNVSTFLKCYSQMEEKYYPDETVSNCVFYLDLPENAWNIVVAPNPFESILRVDLNQLTNGEYRLIDLQGKVCLSNEFSGEQFEIETENLESGTYFLELRFEGNRIFRQKIIK